MKRTLTVIGLILILGVLIAGPQLRAAPGDTWRVAGVTPIGAGLMLVLWPDAELTPTPTSTATPTATATPTITPLPTPGGSWSINCPDAPFMQQVPQPDGHVLIVIECH